MMEHVAHLKGWIQRCNENHGNECQADLVEGRPPHHIPDWVIDTQDGCIVRGCSVQKYAALSYVWNSAADWEAKLAIDDRLLLKKDNLADFCREGFLRSHILEKVPAVIRDAIVLVRLSGFRYLWVDSLCIVQHEDTTRDRVGLMNEIYSGACFTIIAASTTEGLCGNGYREGQLPRGSISAHHLHSKLLCSHWASRGWTFQEQLLSKRCIIFLDDLCFWDCQREVQWPGSSMSEIQERAGQLGQLAQSQYMPYHRYINGHPLERLALERAQWGTFGRNESRDLASVSPIPDFKLYIELVCRYNNRNFTCDQDVLPAFSGVLEVFSRRSFHGGFISGLPALFLNSALLWQPLLEARRRSPDETATKIAPRAPLPSWSWAGWKCLVDPDSLQGGLDYMASQIHFYRPDPLRTEGTSWRTGKLVDWSTVSDDSSLKPVDGPALLDRFKADWEESSHKPLPTGWSRHVSGAFVHANNPSVLYRYPLPTQNSPPCSLADTNDFLLSCITRTATLRVRRCLDPFELSRRSKSVHFPVFEMDLYNFKPEPMALCSVITLEDNNGRWAGAMTRTQNTPFRPTGREIKTIAISTGSALQRDVAESYPEMIDSQGFCLYAPSSQRYDYYTNDDITATAHTQDHYYLGLHTGRITAAAHTRECLDAGIDVGPFAYRHFSDRSNTSPVAKQTATTEMNQPERYHFYNVLWVEMVDGVMYRKAAGRVPREVWELNCGDPTKIVLG